MGLDRNIGNQNTVVKNNHKYLQQKMLELHLHIVSIRRRFEACVVDLRGRWGFRNERPSLEWIGLFLGCDLLFQRLESEVEGVLGTDGLPRVKNQFLYECHQHIVGC